MTTNQAETSKKRIEEADPLVTVKIRKNGSDFEVVACKPGGSPTPEHAMDNVQQVNDYIRGTQALRRQP
jgi:hypothetical protein